RAAGKTGTAQVFSLRGSRYNAKTVSERLRDHALFMGFAPAEDPQIALALIVENGGWGATAAAPVARKIFDYWLSPSRMDARMQQTAISGQESGDEDAPVDFGESPDAVVRPEDLPEVPEDNGGQP